MQVVNRFRGAALSMLLALAVLAGCGGQPASDDKAGGAQKQVVKFADTQFQTLWINNAIAGFIVEKGFGYPVETVEVTTPIYQQSLAKGDLDVMMELWRTNIIDWYNEVTSSGKVLDLGDTYEKSTQGFYVPRYVIEGDPARGIAASAPDLKSVTDLPKYKALFADPENPKKGQIVNCITGWQCAEINRIKLHAYGLENDYNLLEPGAAAALDSAIVGAYKKGKPFVAYYWEPTWLAGSFDLVQLQEPAYTAACNDEIQKALTGKVTLEQVSSSAGCEYERIGIHKGVSAPFAARAPEVVAFLKKMNVGTEPLNKTAAYMQDQSVSADKAAIWFFEQYQDRWRSWLPDDVRQKVEEALKAAGAKL